MNQTNQNGSGTTSRRKFDETYKRHAVELTLHGDRTVKTVAKELGLPAWQLYEWRKIYAPRPGDSGAPPQTLEEAGGSRAGNCPFTLRGHPDAREGGGPKKITGHPLRNARERYAQIEAMKHEHPVRLLCELLSVSTPSGYYHARRQRPSARQREDAALTGQIRQGPPGQPRLLWVAAHCRRPAGDGHAHEQTPLRPSDAGSGPAREKETPASASHHG